MADVDLFLLIARHLAAGGNPADELLAFKALPEEKAQIVENRLRVLDRCVGDGASLSTAIDTAAVSLGSSQRQVYRLLARLREFGPVKGLTPGTYRTERPKVARDGLDPAAEEVLASRLRENPRASQASLEAAVVARCTELGLPAPTQYSVRQRVLQLRASGQAPSSATFGSRLALDQTAININITVGEGKSLPSIVTLLMDEGLGLIIGASLTSSPRMQDFGLLIARANAASTVIPELRKFEITIAGGLGHLTWVASPFLEHLVPLAEAKARSAKNKARLKIVSEGSKRHGSEIMRIIGDRLGPYILSPRQSFRSEPRPVEDPGVDYEEASKRLDLAVESWNRKRLQTLGISPAALSAVRDRRMWRVLKEFEGLLEPVHQAIEAEQFAARDQLDPNAEPPDF
ncbi:hypothetical protein [Sphingomonas kyeonggiensis]|uniref:Uncharacterized protein n=1 Tax=Sphingomonas kyeonggiensis TaxID=1268553 RepID=A0A7W6JVV6_9SPHN|nr:hypothetical protein [Sphingomonas kyeonggiensis]MBB4100496.1 hypothetical protein [Sphingomonas kyeonggiensis]